MQVDIRSAEARSLHQALRAEWDVYKIILDLLRATPKLENVYHETARKAFIFCREYHRQQEFRRLCEVLRSHFSLLIKNRNRDETDIIFRGDLHLETRIQQLIVAADLEIWRECAATAEDIYALGIHDLFARTLRSYQEPFVKAREKLPRWLGIFYEKLTQVFWVGENYLFYALASIRLFIHIKTFKKNITPKQISQQADLAVLAVLAVPQHSSRYAVFI